MAVDTITSREGAAGGPMMLLRLIDIVMSSCETVEAGHGELLG